MSDPTDLVPLAPVLENFDRLESDLVRSLRALAAEISIDGNSGARALIESTIATVAAEIETTKAKLSAQCR